VAASDESSGWGAAAEEMAAAEAAAQEARRARAEQAAAWQAEAQALQAARAEQAREAAAAAAAVAQEAAAELPSFVEGLVADNSEVGIKAVMKALKANGGWAATVQKAAVKEALHRWLLETSTLVHGLQRLHFAVHVISPILSRSVCLTARLV
jgi:hypothetical protein